MPVPSLPFPGQASPAGSDPQLVQVIQVLQQQQQQLQLQQQQLHQQQLQQQQLQQQQLQLNGRMRYSTMLPDQLGDDTLRIAAVLHPGQMLELRAADVPPAFFSYTHEWPACTNEEELQVTGVQPLCMYAFELDLKYASFSFRSWQSRFVRIAPYTTS